MSNPDTPGDAVNHPPHYTGHPSGVECITVTEHMGFNLGNAVKYIWRADLKGNAIEDLEKAAWYLSREIDKRRAAKPPEQAIIELHEGKQRANSWFLKGMITQEEWDFLTSHPKGGVPWDENKVWPYCIDNVKGFIKMYMPNEQAV